MILEKILSIRSREFRFDLSIPETLSKALDYPERAYPVIHVTGTNGKGSVCLKIAKSLELAGLKVGLFTSPHLIHYEERIQINGSPISLQRVEEGLQKLAILAEERGVQPGFFDYTTFLAFDYFREQKVDVAVIEVGIGAKVDPTNVVDPILSVVTSVGYDHMDYLGDTLDAIATDKAAIIKYGKPVVLGYKARLGPFYERARAVKAPLFEVTCDHLDYEEENQATARLSLKLLKDQFPLLPEQIEEGLTYRMPCRFELREGVLCDVAHNPDGFQRLLQSLQTHYSQRSWRFVVGMSRDKDYITCLNLIGPHASHLHLVPANSPTAATVEELIAAARDFPYSSHTSVQEGLHAAKAAATQDELIILCGSFYVMLA